MFLFSFTAVLCSVCQQCRDERDGSIVISGRRKEREEWNALRVRRETVGFDVHTEKIRSRELVLVHEKQPHCSQLHEWGLHKELELVHVYVN